MNMAGVMMYAYRTYGSFDWAFTRSAARDLGVPYDPLPIELTRANLPALPIRFP
jgi:hypothetical protein